MQFNASSGQYIYGMKMGWIKVCEFKVSPEVNQYDIEATFISL